jgi:hypothetical protein
VLLGMPITERKHRILSWPNVQLVVQHEAGPLRATFANRFLEAP